MPFTPGHKLSVGNKGGRPVKTKAYVDAEELARKYTKQAIEGLLALALHAEEANVRRMCWVNLLDRGHGPPKQRVDLETTHQAGDSLLAVLDRIANGAGI